MNSFLKVRRCLRWCVLMTLMSLGSLLYSQNWIEHYMLNTNNSWGAATPTFLNNTTFIQSPNPSLGTATVNVSNGVLTMNFFPVDGAVGVAEFIIEYFPGPWPNFAPATLAYRIYLDSSHVKTKPDYAVVQQNGSVAIAVLENDFTIGGGPLTIEHIASEKHGTATIDAGGESVTFTPDTNFVGLAYFTYVAVDTLGSTAPGKATICVQSNEPPQQVDTIKLSTDSRTPVAVYMPMAGFSIDPDDEPSHGEVDSLAPEVFLYTPEVDYDGTESFTMVSSDDYSRLVKIRVHKQDPPNDFLVPDEIYTHVNETVAFDVRENDLKHSYNIYTYTVPSKGTLTFDDDTNWFTYEPDQGYSGIVEFEYSMNLLGKYEETTVRIFVGDLEPVNKESYVLHTHTNVPIVLNYQIPLEGYDFYITDINPQELDLVHPSEGNLVLHQGYSATGVDVLCDTIFGYDLMVYTPGDGFTGEDAFEILYCVESDSCTLVKIDVIVDDYGDLGPCPCVDGCVWPGDADANGVVNMTDLLNIGWNIGLTGSQRNYSDNTIWLGQHAVDWEQTNRSNHMNTKYNDCDGDGVVTTDDLEPVAQHYMKRHTLVPNRPGFKSEYPFYLIPHETVLDSGDLAVIDIVVGDEQNPVLDMHGFYFALNLPTDIVDSSTLQVEFFENTWLSHDGPSMQLGLQPWNGRVDAGFSRVDGKPASGHGLIGVMTFIIVDDIEGIAPPGTLIPFDIEVIEAGGADSEGTIRDLDGTGTTIYYEIPPERGFGWRSSEAVNPDQLYVFPNPASGNDRINVHYNGDEPIVGINVYDMTGAMMFGRKLDARRTDLDISTLSTGLYIMQVTTTKGVITKKFEVMD